ncbi:MAG TPA: GNAT family N-acetyltransferase [Kofleriaceae bacterium]|jgi:GNAT superfamily N-acetyltransferase|nr:GNAT family N-acetyltransferase [Kofleriaceae bacterium]
MTFTIRELDRRRDRKGVEAIDTSFQTDRIFDVVTDARKVELVLRVLPAPMTKRYSIGEVFAQWARWDHGSVAEADGEIRGFATVGHEPWHARVNLRFLYISPAYRRQGIERALLARVEEHAQSVGASATDSTRAPLGDQSEALGRRGRRAQTPRVRAQAVDNLRPIFGHDVRYADQSNDGATAQCTSTRSSASPANR